MRRDFGWRPDAAARRMLAPALVMEGHNRSEAAHAAGMDRQTLRDWVHRYNDSKLAGLHSVDRRDRPPGDQLYGNRCEQSTLATRPG